MEAWDGLATPEAEEADQRRKRRNWPSGADSAPGAGLGITAEQVLLPRHPMPTLSGSSIRRSPGPLNTFGDPAPSSGERPGAPACQARLEALPSPTSPMRLHPCFPSASLILGGILGILAGVSFVATPANGSAQSAAEPGPEWIAEITAAETNTTVPERQATNPATDAGGQESRTGTPIRWHLTALLGSRGLGNDSHPFGGLEATLFRGRFGAAATGHLGSGNDYRSTLLAAGPALHIADLGATAFSAWGGVARYQEELDVGPSRQVTGALLTATARRPLLWGSLSLQVGWLVARLDEPDFQQSVPVNSLRIAVGIGR